MMLTRTGVTRLQNLGGLVFVQLALLVSEFTPASDTSCLGLFADLLGEWGQVLHAHGQVASRIRMKCPNWCVEANPNIELLRPIISEVRRAFRVRLAVPNLGGSRQSGV